jgi:hypothetical protein
MHQARTPENHLVQAEGIILLLQNLLLQKRSKGAFKLIMAVAEKPE